MQYIAIYDLDRTILAKPTFTAFLIFAARQKQRSLVWRAPVWIAALLGYKLKLYGRKPMKQFGIRLFIGKEISVVDADQLAKGFTASVVPSDVCPGAINAMEQDRAKGCRMVIATAAPEFYVDEIARQLDFNVTIATRHMRLVNRAFSNRIDGENCYAEEKFKRVQQWFAEEGLDRNACHIRFYSDHPSDGPTLDWADEGVLVGSTEKIGSVAKANGWQFADFNSAIERS